VPSNKMGLCVCQRMTAHNRATNRCMLSRCAYGGSTTAGKTETYPGPGTLLALLRRPMNSMRFFATRKLAAIVSHSR